MTMMAMPAMMLSSANHACTSPPMALALAPNAMNTVENPATNNSAANTVSARTIGSGSAPASRSSEAPAR